MAPSKAFWGCLSLKMVFSCHGFSGSYLENEGSLNIKCLQERKSANAINLTRKSGRKGDDKTKLSM